VTTVAVPRNGRISLKEAAAIIGVHPETLRRWAHEGLITYWAFGSGRYMTFDPADVHAFIEAGRRSHHSP
jgi:excisionase family DNA binding protein